MTEVQAAHPVYYYIPLQYSLASINQPKSPVAGECYHVLVTTNVTVKAMARRQEGYVRKCTRRGQRNSLQ